MGRTKGKHYHLIVLGLGKSEIERVYIEMTTPEESPEAGLGRWLDSVVKAETNSKSRKSTRERVAREAQARVLYQQVCHPSSWWREQQEAPGYVPPGRKRQRRRAA